jgi:hypothetical protein
MHWRTILDSRLHLFERRGHGYVTPCGHFRTRLRPMARDASDEIPAKACAECERAVRMRWRREAA